METYLLRKGSPGLNGTFENAAHHAIPAIPLIHATLGVIQELSPYIKSWGQGKNIHIIEAMDGRKLALRPYHTTGNKWGIEISISVSRSHEIPLMTFEKLSRTNRLLIVMREFLKVKENFYQKITEEARYSFKEAETCIEGDGVKWKKIHADDLPAHRPDHLRCPGCHEKMTFHKGPQPHFEHVKNNKGKCPLYKVAKLAS